MKTIELTDEQYKKLCQGEEITIKPPKKKWEPPIGKYYIKTDGQCVPNQNDNYDSYTKAGAERNTGEDGERASKRMVRMNILSAWACEHGCEVDFMPKSENCTIQFYEGKAWIYFTSCDIPGVVWMTEVGAEHFFMDYNEGLIEL